MIQLKKEENNILLDSILCDIILLGCDGMNTDEKRNIKRNQIIVLVQTYYHKFPFLQTESLDSLTNKAIDRYLDCDLSIDQINEEFIRIVKDRREELEKRYDQKNVKQNHEMIYSKLEQLVDALNKEGIDYQLAGALCGYIKYGQESNRCHDDIDIHLNERDIAKFESICKQLGLKFQDNRLHSPRVLENGIPSGEHEVLASLDNSDFHIGAFCFERLADGTIITKGYYHDNKDNPCCREEIIGADLAKEIFEKEEVNFRGKPISITAPEYVYLLKQYTGSYKDQTDIQFLKDKIDMEKVARIQTLEKTEKYVQNIPVLDLPNAHKVSTPMESPNNEMNEMLKEAKEAESPVKENSSVKEKPKQYVKNNSDVSSQRGFSTGYIIALILLSVIAIILISCIVYYLYFRK